MLAASGAKAEACEHGNVMKVKSSKGGKACEAKGSRSGMPGRTAGKIPCIDACSVGAGAVAGPPR